MIQLIQISGQDSSAQIQILREVVIFSQDRPTLMSPALINSIQRYLTSSKTSNGVAQMLIDKLWDVCSRRYFKINPYLIIITDNRQQASIFRF
jgi:hypothetical protein